MVWAECMDLLVGMYEGGILAIDPIGRVIWHCRKYWDDLFEGVEGNLLIFSGFEGSSFRIDARSGVRD
jgi:hypothetical protein